MFKGVGNQSPAANTRSKQRTPGRKIGGREMSKATLQIALFVFMGIYMIGGLTFVFYRRYAIAQKIYQETGIDVSSSILGNAFWHWNPVVQRAFETNLELKNYVKRFERIQIGLHPVPRTPS